MVVGPTRRYGYLDEHGREPVEPRQEIEHIKQVLSRYYRRLLDMPVIVGERNFVTGTSTTPTLVLVDWDGLASLYHPGKMVFGELAGQMRTLLH